MNCLDYCDLTCIGDARGVFYCNNNCSLNCGSACYNECAFNCVEKCKNGCMDFWQALFGEAEPDLY